jgi:uncharacterized membrane protein YeiB
MARRYHGLDAVRGAALTLGIVLHAMLIFSEPWLFAEVLPNAARPTPETPDWVAALTLWIHL